MFLVQTKTLGQSLELSIDFYFMFFKEFLLLLLQFRSKTLFQFALKLSLPKKLYCDSFICSKEGNYYCSFLKNNCFTWIRMYNDRIES